MNEKANETQLIGQYEKILETALEYDSCFEKEKSDSGWDKYTVKEDSYEKYLELKEKLEDSIPEWMYHIRVEIGKVPESAKKCNIRTALNLATQEEYSHYEYHDRNFSSLLNFFNNIKNNVERSSGVLNLIRNDKTIYTKLRDLRADVRSLSHTLDLFIPKNMVTIKEEVEVIFKLRDHGMDEVAERLEGIDDEDDLEKKCLRARTALEGFVAKYCEENGIDVKKGFYTNLDNAIQKGLTEKQRRESIGGHYSFVSKIIHNEIEATPKNTKFAVNGVINIIGSLI